MYLYGGIKIQDLEHEYKYMQFRLTTSLENML